MSIYYIFQKNICLNHNLIIQLQILMECGVHGVNVQPNVVEDQGIECVIVKVAQSTVKRLNNFVTLMTVYQNLNSEV